MSWEPKTRRWQKMYRRKRLTVSCRQLGTPETMEASRDAANAWFVARKAVIDAQDPRHPHLFILDVLNGFDRGMM
jgi:hypothetical protein